MRFREFVNVVANPDGSIGRPNAPQDNVQGLEAGPPYPREDMDAVRALQTRLEELGYSVGSTGIDGKYGPRTQRAVSAYKRDFNVQNTDRGRTISAIEIQQMQRAEAKDNPTPTGNEGGGRAGTGIVLPDPEGEDSGNGELRVNPDMNPSFDDDGRWSRMTQADADTEMAETLRMARRMAAIFGQPLTINDAIALGGTSRERETQGSQHFHGTALDLSTVGLTDEEKLQMVNAALQAGFTGFGFGSNILHVDRGPRRHWSYGNSTFGGETVADLGQTVAAYRGTA